MRTIKVTKWNDETAQMALPEYQDQYLGSLGHVQRLAEYADIRNMDGCFTHTNTNMDAFNNAVSSLKNIVRLEFNVIYEQQNKA